MPEVRLIDANALLKDCENKGNFYSRIAREFLLTAPTVDAEPVRYAHWVNDTYCSYCKRFPVDVSVSISNQELTKYFSRCPHCGARMIKDRTEVKEDSHEDSD